jgi:hypothetical protein
MMRGQGLAIFDESGPPSMRSRFLAAMARPSGGTLLPRLCSPLPFPFDQTLTSSPQSQTERRVIGSSGKMRPVCPDTPRSPPFTSPARFFPTRQDFNDQSVRYGQSKSTAARRVLPPGARKRHRWSARITAGTNTPKGSLSCLLSGRFLPLQNSDECSKLTAHSEVNVD